MEPNVWFKATASNPSGNCVETLFYKATKSGPNSDNCVEIAFATATDCGAGSCVEVGQAEDPHAECTREACKTPGIVDGDIVVRDSKDNGKFPEGTQPIIVFKPEQWRALLTLVHEQGSAWADRDIRDGVIMRFIESPSNNTRLWYTADEWDAFVDGVDKGEFDFNIVDRGVLQVQ